MTKRTDKEGKMDGEGRGGPRMARRAHLCILKGHGRFSRCFTGKCLFCVRFAAAKPGNTQVVLYPLDWHWMTTLDQDRL